MKATELELQGKALQAAMSFEAAFPNAVFTSGRRSQQDQARAMASNVVLNRSWIAQTYKPSRAAGLCHSWVTSHPGSTQQQIADGLLQVLNTLTDEELSHLSLHMSGQAFDLQPVGGVLGGQMVSFLHELAEKYGGAFLEQEGGLRRWHAQFRD